MNYCTVKDIKDIALMKPILWKFNDNMIIEKINSVTSWINKELKTTNIPSDYVPSILNRICKLKTAYQMLTEEYGKADGKYLEFNNELEYLIARIKERVIILK